MNRNDKKRILEIMNAYFKGISTQEEEVFLNEYYDCIVDNNLSRASFEQDQWEKITQRIRKGVTIKVAEHYRRVKIMSLFLKYLWVIISVGILLIGCGMIYLGYFIKNRGSQLDISNIKSIRYFSKEAIIRLFNNSPEV